MFYKWYIYIFPYTKIMEEIKARVRAVHNKNPDVILVLARRKNSNLICYEQKNDHIEPYWLMASGSRRRVSFLSKKIALGVKRCRKGNGVAFCMNGTPHIHFSLSGSTVTHDEKMVEYAFVGERSSLMDPTPSYITVHYKDDTFKTIKRI